MTFDQPSGGQRVAADIADIAEAALGVPERAQALLEPLGRLVPFQGAWISLLDPERRVQPPVVAHGFGADDIAYMSGPAGVEEIEQLGLFRLRGATHVSDLSVPLQEVYSWTQFLAPAGFCGGLAVGLFAPDGRHLGVLGLNTDTDAHPTEAARELITALASVIAHAIDPLRSITAAARIVTDARAGVVLTRVGPHLRCRDSGDTRCSPPVRQCWRRRRSTWPMDPPTPPSCAPTASSNHSSATCESQCWRVHPSPPPGWQRRSCFPPPATYAH
jgi:GAF domain-containing protein